eukprot:3266043-Pleurochrysis_carterae.AAC.1
MCPARAKRTLVLRQLSQEVLRYVDQILPRSCTYQPRVLPLLSHRRPEARSTPSAQAGVDRAKPDLSDAAALRRRIHRSATTQLAQSESQTSRERQSHRERRRCSERATHAIRSPPYTHHPRPRLSRQ